MPYGSECWVIPGHICTDAAIIGLWRSIYDRTRKENVISTIKIYILGRVLADDGYAAICMMWSCAIHAIVKAKGRGLDGYKGINKWNLSKLRPGRACLDFASTHLNLSSSLWHAKQP